MNNMNNIVYDERARGLSAFFSKIYGLVGLGVAVSALVSFITINYFASTMMSLMTGNSMIFLFLWIGLLVFMFPVQRAAAKNSPAAMPLFFVFAAAFGFLLSFTLVMYNIKSITVAFAVSAGMFVTMSVVGRVTKRDLSGMGKALMAAVIGLLIALVVNMFLRSSGLDYLISILGVVIFSGFIAWDNQKIIQVYNGNNGQVQDGWAVSMALSLYLDFINLFLFLLRLFGGSSRN